jgi:nucleotide-binding universal stress UspA family protein
MRGGFMITKILVPTDGSETAWKSVKYAIGLAKQMGSTITLLAVVDDRFIMAQTIPDEATSTRLIAPVGDYLRGAAEVYLEKASRQCKKDGIQSKKVIRHGHPAEEIVKEAKKSKADLIIMGSHGRTALQAALLGSVTYGVIHKDTKIPVLVVRK